MIEKLYIYLEPCIRIVTGILIHSLWQGIFIGLLAAIALSLLRKSNARIRYAVSCSAMLAVVAAVAVTTGLVWPNEYSSNGPVSAVRDEPASGKIGRDADAAVAIPASTRNASLPNQWWKFPSISRHIFVIWVAGVMALSVYHLAGWRRTRKLIKTGTSPVPFEWQVRFEKLCSELRIKSLITLLRSSLVKVPCVVGWMKPVILIPVSMFTALNPSEIEMILVHELAHIRRYDVLINIMQTVMETLFFFNPAIWWISRQIRIEREDCCDDMAILRAGSRLRYARALTNLEELKMLRTNFGSALNSTPLRHRIRRIVGIARPPFYSAVMSFTGMFVIASLIVVVLGSFGVSNDSALQASEKIEAVQTFKPESGDLHGKWQTEWVGDELRILVYGRRSSGMYFALDRRRVADIIAQGQKQFQIVRDAGMLFLMGTLKNHRREVEGDGEWYFRPDTLYMRFMGRYGLQPDERQRTLSLAIFDISRKYLAEMEDLGYHGLSVDQLISAGVFGITPELVEEYRKLGYPDLTYQQLLSMQVQGVNPNDARRFDRLGVGHLTPEQLISARIQGLTPEYVESFRKAGFRDLTFANFGTLHAFKLDVDDFEDCYRHRFMDLSEENLVWVCGFGITREDIEKMKDRGYTDMDSIISMLAKEYGR